MTLPDGVKEWTLFNVYGKALEEVANIETVSMRNVRVDTNDVNDKAKVRFSNVKAKTKKEVKVNIVGSTIESIVF